MSNQIQNPNVKKSIDPITPVRQHASINNGLWEIDSPIDKQTQFIAVHRKSSSDHRVNNSRIKQRESSGFTLLEVMVAMAIIAIALTAVLGSQSQGVSLASEAKFNTTAPLLAQSKIAEIEMTEAVDLSGNSGDFGEDFPGYTWEFSVEDVVFEKPENVSDLLKRIDLKVSWGDEEQYQYRLRLYRFFPKSNE
jgi:general secretion pathway protein I